MAAAGLLGLNVDKQNPLSSLTGYDPEKSDVNASTDTVQGQLTSMMNKGSPIEQMARTDSDAKMAQRGLLSSSLALGESDKAAYGAMLPIASADANTYNTNRLTNLQNSNTSRQFNAGQTNAGAMQTLQGNQQIEAINAQGGVQSGLQAQKGAIDTGLQKLQGEQQIQAIGESGKVQSGLSAQQAQQQSQLQSEKAGIDQQLLTATGQQQIDLQTRKAAIDQQLQTLQGTQQIGAIQAQGQVQAELSEQQQQHQRELLAQKAEIDKQLLTADSAQKQVLQAQKAAIDSQILAQQGTQEQTLQGIKGEQAKQIAQIQNDNQVALQQLKGDQAENITRIDDEYKNLLQTDANAAGLYTNLLQAMTSVATNSTMDTAAKQSAVDSMTTWLRSGLGLIGGVSGYDLESLLNFPT